MSTTNDRSNVDAVNAAIKARTPRGRLETIAELERKIAELTAGLALIMQKMAALQSALKVTANGLAKAAKAKPDRPFWTRSAAHKAAWERFHGRQAPTN